MGLHSTPFAPEQTPLSSTSAARKLHLLFAGMVALLCVWVLSLPLFPMQDGPMHLYLASVLGDLLGHGQSVYAHFYRVQHLLPPYSLHYYLLILLMHFLPAAFAEKLVVCAILICFCFGCRFLATSHGPSGAIISFLCLPIALNWPLMMGFQNYLLALGLACWTLGVWSRLPRSPSLARRMLFAGLCAVVAITHPVPLLLVLGFCAVDLTVRVLSRSLVHYAGRDALALACASTLLLYLCAFTDKRQSAKDFHATQTVFTRFHYFLGLHGLEFLNTATLGARLQQLSLYIVLGIAICLALRTLGAPGWRSSHTWLVLTVLFTLAMPFLPDDLSGSKALVSRLQVVTFIGFIAAASGVRGFGVALRNSILLIAIASTLGTLALCQLRLSPIAKRIAAIDQDSAIHAMPPASTGLLLSAHAIDEASFQAVTYEPLHWQAVNYFLSTKTILLNPPWMDSTWLPLTAEPALLTGRFAPWTLECYTCLRKQIAGSAVIRTEVLSQTDFIIFIDQESTATRATLADVLDAELADGSRYPWACDPRDWYWFCRKGLFDQ